MALHPAERKRYFPEEAPGELDPIRRALQENEDWNRDLVEHSEDLLCIHDLQGRLLAINPSPARVLGYAAEELLQIPMREIIAPEFRNHFDDYLSQIAQAGAARGFMAVMTRSGERRIWEYHNTLRTEGVASPIVRGMARDVTEQKKAERLAREAGELNRQIISSASEGLVVYDRNLRCLAWNPFVEQMTGVAASTALGKSHQELVRGMGGQELASAMERAVQGETIALPDIRSEGQHDQQWVSCRTGPLRNQQGEITGVIVMLHDVTERHRAENRLQEYERVVEDLEEMIVVVDRDYRYLIANRAYLKYREMESKQVLGHLVEEVVGQEVFETTVKRNMDRCFQGEVIRYELRYKFPNLGERDLFTSYFPIEGPTGIDRLACVLRDITERKQAESSLRGIVEELRLAKERLAEEKVYLEEEIHTELGFGEIVGKSKALRDVLEQVSKVATSDATVLIMGETGTGKELVARAIHRMSNRRESSFIKMNCAAIPSGLLESELFGHERGAFTGAVAKKIGRLELADRGTLFLDEVGEIPLALQPKLLRVLQDQEFERLGSTHTLKVDFRLIAATNRDLWQGMQDRQFRSDLYYRLNVFPVRVPPLRDRREDIPLLTDHFVRKCAVRMNKTITSIPKKTMELLQQWDWPGNIRELENFVERSVILTRGSVLQAPLKELEKLESASDDTVDETLEAMEREHIIHALRQSHGRLSGSNGAAERLGMNRTTLQSKLKRLRIDHRQYRD